MSSLHTVANSLAGIAGVNITPFLPDSLDIDETGLRRVVRVMEDGGIDVIVPCGGTGEYYALTDAERRQVVEIVLDEVRHTPVVPGVGLDVRSATDAAQHAERHGASGVMVHQPVGGGLHPDGICDYYRAIAAAINIPLVAYVRDPIFSPTVLTTLAQEASVIAVKYAVTDPRRFAKVVSDVSQSVKIVWLCGTAESWLPSFWPGGATGFTSGIANFAPGASAAMREAMRAGDVARMRAVWARLRPLEELRDLGGGVYTVAAVKAAAEELGMCSAAVRPPHQGFREHDRPRLRSILQSLDLSAVEAD
jgi:4-hydroxy-tetrahydrodipicolinate synthase